MIRDEYAMRLTLWSDIQDHLPRLHAEASIGDCVVIELGVRGGNSTAAFLAAVDEFGGHVHGCDIRRPGVPWANHPQWTFYEGDDLELADQLPDGVDVLFIDTSHFYDQTCAELEMYVPKVKPGGVVLLHDTELKYPEGRPWDDPPYPVRLAVDLYCGEHGLTPEFVEGCNGLGVIRIPEGNDD
jgi:predicted O-methyltransferase YrrM